MSEKSTLSKTNGGVKDANEKKGSLLLAWQVRGKHCLVIGGGEVALSRIHHLIIAQAKITVITGTASEKNMDHRNKILELHRQGLVHKVVERDYISSDLTMYQEKEDLQHIRLDSVTESDYQRIDAYMRNNRFEVVCCCIDDHELSTKVYYQCKLLHINANIADKPDLCDFYFGSMINKDNLQIMISTNGKSPRLLKIIKDIIQKEINGIDLNKAIENLNLIRFHLRTRKLPENDVNTIELRMNWIKDLTDLFSTKQWSELEITPDNVSKIIDRYPEFPPSDYSQFKTFMSE